MIKINLQGTVDSLLDGLALLLADLGISLDTDGFPVTVKQGDHLDIEINDGRGNITYRRKVEFFRGLCFADAAHSRRGTFASGIPSLRVQRRHARELAQCSPGRA